jgi:hypothetical protein
MSLATGRWDLDLGCGHWLTFTCWKPDRALNPQYSHLPDNDRIGGIITHELPNGKICEGSIWFDCDVTREVFAKHDRWTVSSWEPLTCSPSFLCHCGDHGYIREGKWVPA